MLVLGRHVGEAVRIGPEIRVVVTRVQGRKVAIGIEAPAEFVILREELCTRRSSLVARRSSLEGQTTARDPTDARRGRQAQPVTCQEGGSDAEGTGS